MQCTYLIMKDNFLFYEIVMNYEALKNLNIIYS